MKILILTQYFWPEAFRVNDLATGLRERGHRVEILTGMPNYPDGRRFPGYGWLKPSRDKYEGVPVTRVPLVARGRSGRWRLAANYLSFMLSASVLGPLRCRGDVDLVFVYQPSPVTVGLPGLLFGRLKNAPVMLWIQDLWPDTLEALDVLPGKLTRRTVAWLSNATYRRCDRLLVQSRSLGKRLEDREMRPGSVLYFPNWAESYYRPLEPGTVVDPLPGPRRFRVLFAGNLGTAQSLETIVDAAARLEHVRDLNWVIVGDGHMRGWLQAEIAARGLGAKFTLVGRRPAEAMPAHFAHADGLLVTLRPDPVFALTIPSKLQSYLACGRPVVAAINGEGAEIVNEARAGVSCAAGDSAALADAVMRLYRLEPREREEMGRHGRAYYESNFERGHLLDQLEAWMIELTNRTDADTRSGR